MSTRDAAVTWMVVADERHWPTQEAQRRGLTGRDPMVVRNSGTKGNKMQSETKVLVKIP